MDFNIDGKAYQSTKEILSQVARPNFANAARLNGWHNESLGLWQVNKPGTITGATIDQWLISQKHFQAADVADAIGLTRGRIAAIARKHGLRLSPVGIGKYPRDKVIALLGIMDKLAKCPECGGLAVAGKDGAVTCLDCKN
jgi:hypothetical protein